MWLKEKRFDEWNLAIVIRLTNRIFFFNAWCVQRAHWGGTTWIIKVGPWWPAVVNRTVQSRSWSTEREIWADRLGRIRTEDPCWASFSLCISNEVDVYRQLFIFLEPYIQVSLHAPQLFQDPKLNGWASLQRPQCLKCLTFMKFKLATS